MAGLEDISLEARDELASLARHLAENPKTRKQFLRLTKEAKPDLPIPELEIEDHTNAALAAANKRVEELENKHAQREAVEKLQRRRHDLVKSGKAADESEVEAIEKLMLERGITSHDTAADYHRYMKEHAAPTTSAFQMNVIDDTAQATLSKYWKNPARAAREEAFKVMQELRSPRRPIGL